MQLGSLVMSFHTAEDSAGVESISVCDDLCRDEVSVDELALLDLVLGILEVLLALRLWRRLLRLGKVKVSGEDTWTVPDEAMLWARWQSEI